MKESEKIFSQLGNTPDAPSDLRSGQAVDWLTYISEDDDVLSHIYSRPGEELTAYEKANPWEAITDYYYKNFSRIQSKQNSHGLSKSKQVVLAKKSLPYHRHYLRLLDHALQFFEEKIPENGFFCLDLLGSEEASKARVRVHFIHCLQVSVWSEILQNNFISKEKDDMTPFLEAYSCCKRVNQLLLVSWHRDLFKESINNIFMVAILSYHGALAIKSATSDEVEDKRIEMLIGLLHLMNNISQIDEMKHRFISHARSIIDHFNTMFESIESYRQRKSSLPRLKAEQRELKNLSRLGVLVNELSIALSDDSFFSSIESRIYQVEKRKNTVDKLIQQQAPACLPARQDEDIEALAKEIEGEPPTKPSGKKKKVSAKKKKAAKSRVKCKSHAPMRKKKDNNSDIVILPTKKKGGKTFEQFAEDKVDKMLHRLEAVKSILVNAGRFTKKQPGKREQHYLLAAKAARIFLKKLIEPKDGMFFDDLPRLGLMAEILNHSIDIEHQRLVNADAALQHIDLLFLSKDGYSEEMEANIFSHKERFKALMLYIGNLFNCINMIIISNDNEIRSYVALLAKHINMVIGDLVRFIEAEIATQEDIIKTNIESSENKSDDEKEKLSVFNMRREDLINIYSKNTEILNQLQGLASVFFNVEIGAEQRALILSKINEKVKITTQNAVSQQRCLVLFKQELPLSLPAIVVNYQRSDMSARETTSCDIDPVTQDIAVISCGPSREAATSDQGGCVSYPLPGSGHSPRFSFASGSDTITEIPSVVRGRDLSEEECNNRP